MDNEKNVKYIETELRNLQQRIEADKAGFASTMLHRYRKRFDEIVSIRRFLFQHGKLDITNVEWLEEVERPIFELIYNRLQSRLLWVSHRIDDTIEARKNKGTYKGEFTTAVIIANAFNDIFDGEFDFKAEV